MRYRRLPAGAGTAVKLSGKLGNDVPLRRAGVLSLIDKDMINAAVNPEKHPCSNCRIIEKLPCFQNQIIKVQPAAFLLPGVVKFQKPGRKPVQRQGFICGSERKPGVAGRGDAIHEIVQRGNKISERAAGGLSRKRARF